MAIFIIFFPCTVLAVFSGARYRICLLSGWRMPLLGNTGNVALCSASYTCRVGLFLSRAVLDLHSDFYLKQKYLAMNCAFLKQCDRCNAVLYHEPQQTSISPAFDPKVPWWIGIIAILYCISYSGRFDKHWLPPWKRSWPKNSCCWQMKCLQSICLIQSGPPALNIKRHSEQAGATALIFVIVMWHGLLISKGFIALFLLLSWRIAVTGVPAHWKNISHRRYFYYQAWAIPILYCWFTWWCDIGIDGSWFSLPVQPILILPCAIIFSIWSTIPWHTSWVIIPLANTVLLISPKIREGTYRWRHTMHGYDRIDGSLYSCCTTDHWQHYLYCSHLCCVRYIGRPAESSSNAWPDSH